LPFQNRPYGAYPYDAARDRLLSLIVGADRHCLAASETQISLDSHSEVGEIDRVRLVVDLVNLTSSPQMHGQANADTALAARPWWTRCRLRLLSEVGMQSHTTINQSRRLLPTREDQPGVPST
jgi:hypothetical protein